MVSHEQSLAGSVARWFECVEHRCECVSKTVTTGARSAVAKSVAKCVAKWLGRLQRVSYVSICLYAYLPGLSRRGHTLSVTVTLPSFSDPSDPRRLWSFCSRACSEDWALLPRLGSPAHYRTCTSVQLLDCALMQCPSRPEGDAAWNC